MAVIEVENLVKDFNGIRAVDNLIFDVLDGEILGILGPNGAGKTTTLQMLLGLTTPTSGVIRVFGMDLQKNRGEILQQVNFSSTYVSLPYSLTVFENLNVFAGLYGIRSPREKIKELLEIFEIEDLRDSLVRKLSSGQITRVCLAKALLNEPKVLFLDEPTASLDPDMADKTRRLLKRIRAVKGITILYTSHNMREMEEMSDRLIFLERGRIVAEGTSESILAAFEGKDLEDLFLKIARGDYR